MSDELIDRFFRKNCSRQEADRVIAYLSDRPEVLDKYLSREEWEQSAPVQMSDEFWDEVWTEMRAKKRQAVRRVWMKRAAVAATITAFATLAYLAWYQPKTEKTPVAVSRQLPETEKKIVLNSTNTLMTINLPDSSVVSISPRSVIAYDIPFMDAYRDVSLEGRGRFAVKSDASRPFTVYAGGISTTALGTEFTIDTKERQTNNTTVKLHTGKVVIKNTGPASAVFSRPVYLVAGQQLDYNESAALVSVGAIKNEQESRSAMKAPTVTRLRKQPAKDELTFVNSSLPEVMNRLSEYFGTKIKFDAAELKAMNFTGTVTRQDSPAVVLKVIAQMNGLEVIGQNEAFTIKKTH